MKRSTASLVQAAILLIGIGALAFLLWEPHVEGRNANATFFEIYFQDPFLAYAYVGSTPFFIAIYRAFGLFARVRQTGTFSRGTVDALRSIKHCAMVLIGFVAVGVVIIAIIGDKEDRPAGFFMGFLVIVAASVVATASAMFGRKLHNTLSRPEGGRA